MWVFNIINHERKYHFNFDEMKKLTFSIENETVVQVFGHNPIGYGISFDYVEKNSILINLDTTNSFANTKDNDSSKLMLIFNNGIPKVYTYINFTDISDNRFNKIENILDVSANANLIYSNLDIKSNINYSLDDVLCNKNNDKK